MQMCTRSNPQVPCMPSTSGDFPEAEATVSPFGTVIPPTPRVDFPVSPYPLHEVTLTSMKY